jgi:serine/threonine protein phosphatase PrpC
MDLLRQLFQGHDTQPEPKDIVTGTPFSVPETEPEPSFLPSKHDIQIGIGSDPGRIRDHNEDASLAWQFVLAQEGQPPLPVGLFILADGMGGHVQGAQASALATRLVAGHIIRQISLPLLSADETLAERPPIHEVLTASVRIAHQAVIQRFPEAGTTMTTALMLGEQVYIAHVGDSRAYRGERGSLTLLTQDHSVAARLLEMGQTTPEEAALQRNILYKAIGQGASLEPDIKYDDLAWGQYLLLCCDGLWGKVTDQEMAAIIEASPTPDAACQNLIAQANESGGEDNISVLLVARGWPLPTRDQLKLGESFGRQPELDHEV